MIICVFHTITLVLKAAGASEAHIEKCWCIGYDLAFAVINFNGTLLQMCKGHVSGEALTVLVNSHCNSLYIRYAYALSRADKSCADFKSNVALMTYGDDFIGNVKVGCDFDFIKLKYGLKSVGITVTPADKEAADYELMNILNINFLKRVFRFDNIIGRFVCPLDINSIRKSLMVIVESKTISDDEQIVSCIGSAVREYFWYGQEVFEREKTFLQSIIPRVPGLKHYVQASTFPSWGDLIISYKKVSDKIEIFDIVEYQNLYV